MTSYLIKGARVLLGDTLTETDVATDGTEISEIGPSARGDITIDGSGHILAPGLVDIHGDTFERQIMPRPGVFFEMETAFLDTDRQLAANGITTAYHALTLSWEPGLRSVERGEEVLNGLAAMEDRLAVDHRVQLRWETFAFEAEALIAKTVKTAAKTPSIAFNDHTTMSLRPSNVYVQDRPLVLEDADLIDADDPVFLERIAGSARRSGLSVDDYRAMMLDHWARRDEVEPGIDRLAALGRSHDVPMLSHDDSLPDMRQYWSSKGAKIAEFPMSIAAAQDAKSRAEWVVYGGPNAVRGGSHIGSPGTSDMIARGLCDIMASDYYYPSMLAGAARLIREGQAFSTIWKTVATNPAFASGLLDRGEIAVGKRADLVLLDWPESGAPLPALTLAGGTIAHLRKDLVRS